MHVHTYGLHCFASTRVGTERVRSEPNIAASYCWPMHWSAARRQLSSVRQIRREKRNGCPQQWNKAGPFFFLFLCFELFGGTCRWIPNWFLFSQDSRQPFPAVNRVTYLGWSQRFLQVQLQSQCARLDVRSMHVLDGGKKRRVASQLATSACMHARRATAIYTSCVYWEKTTGTSHPRCAEPDQLG